MLANQILTLQFYYSGFVNNETEETLDTKPKVFSEADNNSETGIYDIIVQGGVSLNYEFVYINGHLSINKGKGNKIFNVS